MKEAEADVKTQKRVKYKIEQANEFELINGTKGITYNSWINVA